MKEDLFSIEGHLVSAFEKAMEARDYTRARMIVDVAKMQVRLHCMEASHAFSDLSRAWDKLPFPDEEGYSKAEAVVDRALHLYMEASIILKKGHTHTCEMARRLQEEEL